jgi:hypothetical protein
MRILRTIIYRVWTILFFLSVLSLLSVANYWWDILASGYHALQSWILAAIELIRS